MVVALAQDSLILALMLTAMAGIILGMGMPTTPAYIMMVALLVPALIKLGAPVPAAHMFAFYFAILSAITPPVALAVFASAGLAKTSIWNTGWEAVRLAAPAYIIPFMFIYEPSLLLTSRRQRVGYGVLALHPEGPPIADLFVVQENRVITDFAAGLFPAKGWIPGRFLLPLLPELR